jgi:hypothetical protein
MEPPPRLAPPVPMPVHALAYLRDDTQLDWDAWNAKIDALFARYGLEEALEGE